MLINLHTHTPYCDGRSEITEMISEAIKLNMSVLGFSSHAPLGFTTQWSLQDLDKTGLYCKAIKTMQEQIDDQDLLVLLGLEADYIPKQTFSFDMLRERFGLSYIIGSIHMVRCDNDYWFIDGPREGYLQGLKKYFANDIRYAAAAFYKQSEEMIRQERPDIIGHLDKIVMHNRNEFFNPEDKWHIEMLDSLLDVIKSSACMIEINTRGLYSGKHTDFYPGAYLFERIREWQIPVMINSDAHETKDLIAGYREAAIQLQASGISHLHYPVNGEIIQLECAALSTML